MRFRRLLLAFLVLLAPAGARAHPHEWVDVASEIVFDGQGRVAAIRHHWRFDEGFSAFALQGLDTDGDRLYSPAELQPLAQENVESLGDFEFFTFVSAGDYKAGFGAPKDYHLDWDGERLTLHFTLPLAQPLSTNSQILLQVYDPEYYIAFSLPGREAVRFVDAPANCRLAVFPAAKPDPAAAAALATIGPDQRELPDEMQGLATGIDNSAEIDCGAAVAAAGAGATAEARNANDAVSRMAGPAGAAGDLSMLAADEPANGAGAPASAAPAAAATAAAPSAEVPSSGGFTARLAAMQTAFNGQLNAALKGMKTDFSAFWWLGGVSFLYGIVHAAGPGHGKVVISSYLLANEQRLRRGVAIAFLSALVQAVVAVAIVGLMAVLLNMTSMAITSTAKLFETGSFALVAALGLYLLMRKGRSAWAMLHGGDPHAGHNHGHHGHGHHGHAHHHGHGHHHEGHDHNHAHGPAGNASPIKWDESAASCACAHHADSAALEKPGLSGAAAAVLSVGMRPCSGALVVLVFALAQGIFWAGIASTFLMALGTAITVAVLAALAVGAKDVAARLFQGNGRSSAQVMLGLEVAAALFITALGAALLAGSLAA